MRSTLCCETSKFHSCYFRSVFAVRPQNLSYQTRDSLIAYTSESWWVLQHLENNAALNKRGSMISANWNSDWQRCCSCCSNTDLWCIFSNTTALSACFLYFILCKHSANHYCDIFVARIIWLFFLIFNLKDWFWRHKQKFCGDFEFSNVTR